MKNITSITINKNNIISCNECNRSQFYCTTPNGGDFVTCPVCNGTEFKYQIYNHKDPNTHYDKYIDDDDLHYNNYCECCGIIYEDGCTHLECGCTSSLYNAHFISKWQKISDGQIYVGMPFFKDHIDWEENASNIKILEWICPNTYKHCDGNSLYSKKNCPQYYRDCELNPVL